MHSLSAKNPFFWPIVLSLAVHSLLLVASPGLWRGSSRLPSQRLPSTASKPNGAPKPFRVKVIPEAPKMPTFPGSVVDVEDNKPSEAKAPDNATYLGLKNRSVAKETQAKNTGLSAQVSPPKSAGSAATPGKKTYQLALSQDYLDQLQDAEAGNQGQAANQSAGSSPSNYLPGVDYGIDTNLNTREYKFASFFIRLKRQLEAVWAPMPIVRSQRVDPRNYVTTVSIVLNRQGYLEYVEMVNSSGNTFLDQEALRAVKQASPYLNPPVGMVNQDGKVYIEEFRFIVTLGGLM